MRLILMFTFLAISGMSFAQTTTAEPLASKPYKIGEGYKKPVDRKNTIFWVTAGTGVTLFTIGAIIGFSDTQKNFSPLPGDEGSKSNTGETLMIAGASLVAVSIPIRIFSKRKQRMPSY